MEKNIPHFVIDCSIDVLRNCPEEQLIDEVFLAAESTQLFVTGEIKVRVNTFEKWRVGNKKEEFIHVFSSIMEGRTVSQKAQLLNEIIKVLSRIFPNVLNIAMNISEFQKAAYLNRQQYEQRSEFSR